jgi:hypothetical protein
VAPDVSEVCTTLIFTDSKHKKSDAGRLDLEDEGTLSELMNQRHIPDRKLQVALYSHFLITD